MHKQHLVFMEVRSMGSRPTIADLATKSGVSVATVDRVLNGRHPVREETSRRVYEAATAIGYHGAGLIRQRLHADLPLVKLGILLQKPESEFYKAFAVTVEKAIRDASKFRGVCVLDFIPDLAPAVVVEKLKAMAPRVHAIAMVAVDHPNITAAVGELRGKGTPVFSLLSDFATGVRSGYVGIDNRKVGRTAAWTIAKLRYLSVVIVFLVMTCVKLGFALIFANMRLISMYWIQSSILMIAVSLTKPFMI
jgi:LacI family transcriptional regulator